MICKDATLPHHFHQGMQVVTGICWYAFGLTVYISCENK